MVRAIGAVLIITATASWGLLRTAWIGGRAGQLRMMVASLQTMKSEICYRLTPMGRVLNIVSTQTSGAVKDFFDNVLTEFSRLGGKPFSELWKIALERTPQLRLDRAQRTALTQLGNSLGRYDAEQQAQALDYAIGRFELFARRAEEERREKGRLNLFMGFASGIFAVVVLL